MALLTVSTVPAAISYIGFTSIAYDAGGNCSVSGVAIGAVATDRRVFLTVNWAGKSSLTSATIGGVAATIHAQNKGVVGSTGIGAAIISAAVPTGTTATVTLTFTGTTGTQPWIGAYRVTGLSSAVPGDAISTYAAVVNPYSGTIDVTNQGILIMTAMVYSDATGFTIVGANENYDSSLAGNIRGDGSSLNVTANEVGRALSITRTGGAGSAFSAPVVAVAFR